LETEAVLTARWKGGGEFGLIEKLIQGDQKVSVHLVITLLTTWLKLPGRGLPGPGGH
jgi:hypothetical protein